MSSLLVTCYLRVQKRSNLSRAPPYPFRFCPTGASETSHSHEAVALLVACYNTLKNAVLLLGFSCVIVGTRR